MESSVLIVEGGLGFCGIAVAASSHGNTGSELMDGSKLIPKPAGGEPLVLLVVTC